MIIATSIATIAIVVVVVIIVLGWAAGSLNKSAQKVRGRNRCVACKSRLKAVQGRYATTCSKCSTRQPWADEVEAARR